MHDGVIATLNVQVRTIRAPGHDPVLSTIKLAADQGILKAGLILSRDTSDEGIPYTDLSQVLGTGTGSTKNYSGTIAGSPLEPGSIVVTDGVETFTDDALGNLIGDAGGTGTAIYKNGSVSVAFDVAVTNTTEIIVTSNSEVAGVLDRDVDTTKSVDGVTIIHGTVKEDELLKGSTPVACVAADFKLLRKKGVYPV
ncbi:MAG: hypothetical protein KKC20_08235 [Proteobacteria bacterium]|nr:hypothetical protein [Pseudomonadota bacterium]